MTQRSSTEIDDALPLDSPSPPRKDKSSNTCPNEQTRRHALHASSPPLSVPAHPCQVSIPFSLESTEIFSLNFGPSSLLRDPSPHPAARANQWPYIHGHPAHGPSASPRPALVHRLDAQRSQLVRAHASSPRMYIRMSRVGPPHCCMYIQTYILYEVCMHVCISPAPPPGLYVRAPMPRGRQLDHVHTYVHTRIGSPTSSLIPTHALTIGPFASAPHASGTRAGSPLPSLLASYVHAYVQS